MFFHGGQSTVLFDNVQPSYGPLPLDSSLGIRIGGFFANVAFQCFELQQDQSIFNWTYEGALVSTSSASVEVYLINAFFPPAPPLLSRVVQLSPSATPQVLTLLSSETVLTPGPYCFLFGSNATVPTEVTLATNTTFIQDSVQNLELFISPRSIDYVPPYEYTNQDVALSPQFASTRLSASVVGAGLILANGQGLYAPIATFWSQTETQVVFTIKATIRTNSSSPNQSILMTLANGANGPSIAFEELSFGSGKYSLDNQ